MLVWKGEGLPSDNLSMENALMILKVSVFEVLSMCKKRSIYFCIFLRVNQSNIFACSRAYKPLENGFFSFFFI